MPALPEFRKKAIEAIGELLSEEDIERRQGGDRKRYLQCLLRQKRPARHPSR